MDRAFLEADAVPQEPVSRSAKTFAGGALAGSAGRPRPSRSPSLAAALQRAEVSVTADQLAYGYLRMPGPDAPGRGELRRLAIDEERTEMLAAVAVRVHVDVAAAVAIAAARARDVSLLPVPPRHESPATAAGYDYAYRAEFPLSVPSDGQFHSVALLARDAPASLRHVTVPRESQSVFRLVSVSNPLEAPLLPGPVDVLVGGEFMMTVPMRHVPPGGKLDLGLGAEQAIKVARNTAFAEEAGGLMGGSLDLKHEIRVEIANRSARRALVEVRERLPVVRDGDDQVKVRVDQVSPPWEPYRQDEPPLEGGYCWRVPVEPGESRFVRAAYTIQIASKNELDGGNRREG
jgi:uncharacterized protein (TIGR02231 family)